MKRTISLLLALMMLLSLCACGEKKETASGTNADQPQLDPPSGIYYDITGIDPRETAMTVNGIDLPMDLYFFLTAYNCSALSQEILNYYTYYGVYEECVNEDGSIKWDGEFMEGRTLAQYARFLVEDSIKSYAVVEHLANTYGVTLTEDETKALNALFEPAEGETESSMLASMMELGLSEDSFLRLMSSNYLFNGLAELVLQEGSPLYLDPADYNEYLIFADHILLMTTNPETGAALSEEEIAAARAKTEELLAQLQAVEGEERYALFAKLGDEYSQDRGRKASPTGYVFGPGEMAAEFESAAYNLEVGQISDIVETPYGFHILLRKDLAEGLVDHPEKLSVIANDHMTSLVHLTVDSAEVSVSEQLTDFDIGAFFTDYNAAIQAKAAEGETTEGNTAEGETAK